MQPHLDTRPDLAGPRLVALRTRHLVAILLGAGIALAALAVVASRSGTDALDLTATLELQRIQVPGFAALMYAVSWFGFSPQNLIMPLIVAAAFALRGLRVESLWVLGTQASGLVTTVVKQLVDRPRPPAELVNVAAPLGDPSFPSGHVVQYTTLFGFALFLVYVLEWRSTPRTVALILLGLPIALIGPSRLYLGQHWLSDVLGGYAVATLLLVPYCWAYARWQLDRARAAGEAARRRASSGPEHSSRGQDQPINQV